VNFKEQQLSCECKCLFCRTAVVETLKNKCVPSSVLYMRFREFCHIYSLIAVVS
jgi:hypothetical protein